MNATDATRSQLRTALASLQELRSRYEALQGARHEPIAVIGLGCRLPGAADPDALWELLVSGGDAITETPRDRWDAAALFDSAPDAPGKVATRWGGFVDGLDRFDASFFGISPREATHLDPQQRLLLEVAWETFEHGGQAVDRLAGTDTGVFVGIHSHSDDYYLLQSVDPSKVDLYSGTGTSHSVASGRLSYVFDLHGPSIAVDTACSSSLVAVHLAVQSLRRGESSLALAAGVNAIIDPTFTMVASRMRMMSPSGRCRPFDAAGDGFVRSEGCAAVLLKRLADAEADGDRVLAVIRGSAVNQDGRSNGLTAPNGASQRSVVRAALADARTDPSEVHLVEAHGTGTPLGDPIEADALDDVFGQGSPRRHPVLLGSVKANIGHTEGAAGVAGLLKAVLSVRNGAVPPVVHFERLNPHIRLDPARFTIPTAVTPWPDADGPRCAGVSSFGWSGTNVHVVVAEAPVHAPASQGHEGPYLLPISAHDPVALAARARGVRDRLAAGLDPGSACGTAAHRRSHLPHRLAVVGRSSADLIDGLDAFAAGQPHRGVRTAVADEGGLTAFVFAGQGSQWVGMGRDLMLVEPVFRSAVERCAALLAPHLDVPINDLLADEIDDARAAELLARVDVVQPVLFAVQVGLAELWSSRGVVPDAVVGHSMGEVAAAYVAGHLSLADAALVIATRSRLLSSIAGQGAMAVVDLPAATATAAVAARPGVSVAAVNDRSSTVLAGPPDAIDGLLADWERDGVFCRRVNVDVASHSPQVEPLLPMLRRELAAVRPAEGRVPLISTVTASSVPGVSLDASYWVMNLREPVRLADALDELVASGHTRFVEIGPHPMLVRSVDEALAAADVRGAAVASMRRESDESVELLAAAGELHAIGVPIDWTSVVTAAPPVDLPAYPWQRERHWLEATRSRPSATSPLLERPDVGPIMHAVRWRAADTGAPAGRAVVRPERWLVVSRPTGTATAAASTAALVARGSAATTATITSVLADVDAVIAAAPAGDSALGIVLLAVDDPAAPRPPCDQELIDDVTALAALVSAIGRSDRPGLIWAVTRGAHVASGEPGDDGRDWPSALAWGAGRAAADELPHVWGGCIDLDPRWPVDEAAVELVGELWDRRDESEVALRRTGRFVPRLVEADLEVPADWNPGTDAAVLVTGGFGAVGRPLGRWLAAEGVRHLVLAGRTALPDRADWATLAPDSPAGRRASFVRELEALGVAVHPVRLDVTDPDAIDAFLAGWHAEARPPIRTAFHAAAGFGGEQVGDITTASVRRQVLPKLVGARALDGVAGLDHLVLFSSVASILPTTGQAAYAAANAALDALAARRVASGRPAVSICWGFWEGSDEVAEGEEGGRLTAEGRSFKSAANAMAAERGLGAFDAAHGLEAMRRLMGSNIAHAMVAQVDRGALARWATDARAGLVSDLVAGDHPATRGGSGELRRAIAAARQVDRRDVAEDGVRHVIGRVLRLPEDRIDRTAPFGALGLDSLMSIEVRNRLEIELGAKLPATLAWNHPTVADLASFVVGLVDDDSHPVAGDEPVADPEGSATGSVPATTVPDLVAGLAALSDDDALDALLGDGAP